MNSNSNSKIQNPKLIWLVRHGESTANLARRKAEAENLLTIDFPEREMDVPLRGITLKTNRVDALCAVTNNQFCGSNTNVSCLSNEFFRTVQPKRLNSDE